ncbi:hypothetical protein M5K25_004688 [Dendrobium thyrsiflorum]|uniref:Uncharacterized protein n=1 Tax=Dendrobium thyrsiflorum TaxID=117978 RepID=A0ABD0VMP5_DENTH
MKCEPQLQEQHAVEILLKNVHGPVAFLLKGFTIKTFEKLLNKASNLMPFLKELSSDKKVDKPVKYFEKRAATPTKSQAPIWEVDLEASQEDVELFSSPVVAETTILFKKEKSENFVERKYIDERCIRVADGGVKTLSPLILSDFYFAPSKAKGQKINKRPPSAFILMIEHNNEMQIDVPSKEILTPRSSFKSKVEIKNQKEEMSEQSSLQNENQKNQKKSKKIKKENRLMKITLSS